MTGWLVLLCDQLKDELSGTDAHFVDRQHWMALSAELVFVQVNISQRLLS